MSTINGVGTMYYGWRDFADGTAIATKWFVLLYLPIWPLERHKLRVLTDLTERKHLTPLEFVAAALGAAESVEHTRYQVLEREPVVGGEVAGTYIWTYLLGELWSRGLRCSCGGATPTWSGIPCGGRATRSCMRPSRQAFS